MDQPAWLMDAFSIMSDELAEIRREREGKD